MGIFDWVNLKFGPGEPPPPLIPTKITPPVSQTIPGLAKAIGAVCRGGVHPQDWANALEPFMVSSGITTPNRIAAFLGQVAVESAGFSTITENLNYSAERLVQVWPNRFNNTFAAQPYARNPEKLANVVYANRMGNGNEASGDGWKYRGAGLIQLTGKANQIEFATDCHIVGDVGGYLRTLKGAAQSACWFWAKRSLNTLADGWQITAISETINGGTAGLADRINLSNTAKKALTP